MIKLIKMVVIAMIFMSGLVYADFFPLIGYYSNRPYGADSCYLNTIMFSCLTDDSLMNSIFNTANSLNMKIILAHAWKRGLHWDHCIDRFSSGQWSIYEAESTCFSHEIGALVNDPSASGGKAWAVKTNQPGWIQVGPWTEEQFVYWVDSLVYYAYFRLKINDTTTTSPVCKLYVRKFVDSDTVLKAYRILTGKDFSNVGVYEDFVVSFKMVRNETGKLDYGIWYMGTNDSIYSDKVDVRDKVADSLKNGWFNTPIQQITYHYNFKPAMFRYYMFDEPNLDQFYACGYVNHRLKLVDQTKGGVQALCDRSLFEVYLDSVKTDELMVNYYPLWGKRCPWADRTPKDSGVLFQRNLDNLCNLIGNARKSAIAHNKKFWFIIQAFGHANTDAQYTWKPEWYDSIPYEDEGFWREPTPRELRCMVWLALAYGAKGICYFIYQSTRELNYPQHFWICGLTDPSAEKRRPLWYWVKEINQELKVIYPILLGLESDTVFKSNTIPPPNCFIKDVSDSLMEIGTFHKNNNPDDKYFIIVNRHCLPKESLNVVVRIEKGTKPMFLYDCSSKEIIVAQQGESQSSLDFVIKLLPGQGRLFHLVPSNH